MQLKLLKNFTQILSFLQISQKLKYFEVSTELKTFSSAWESSKLFLELVEYYRKLIVVYFKSILAHFVKIPSIKNHLI